MTSLLLITTRGPGLLLRELHAFDASPIEHEPCDASGSIPGEPDDADRARKRVCDERRERRWRRLEALEPQRTFTNDEAIRRIDLLAAVRAGEISECSARGRIRLGALEALDRSVRERDR